MPPPWWRTGLLAALGVGVLVVMIVFGVGSYSIVSALRNSGPGVAGSSPSPTGAGPTTSPSQQRFTGNLRDLLLPRPPGASTVDGDSGDETVNLAQAATLYRDRFAAADRLEMRGFSGGAMRTWRTANGDLVFIAVFQFGGPEKANGFLAEHHYALQLLPGMVSRDSLPGVPLGQIFVFELSDEAGYAVVRTAFAEGDLVVMIDVAQRGKPDKAGVIALAQEQFARLP